MNGCEYYTELVHCCFKGSVMGEKSGQVCVITRCNYTLFNEAVNVCCANNNSKVGFVGVSHIVNCLFIQCFIIMFILNLRRCGFL